MALISWLGQYNGRKTIGFWWDIAIVAAFSIVIYVIAMAVRLEPGRAQRYIGDLAEEDREVVTELGATEPATPGR